MDGNQYSVSGQAYPQVYVLIADFNLTFFLKQTEVLKLVQKTKLNSAESELRAREQSRVQAGEKFEEFLQNLSDVDFNNRNEEAKYK